MSKWLLDSIADFFNFRRPTVLLLVLTLVISLCIGAVYNKPHYYVTHGYDHMYVTYHGDWYEYDSYDNDYTPINYDYLPTEIQNHPADYEYDWNDGDWNAGITEFKDSQAYEDNYTYQGNSDWDSDSDYDWDSGSDWDSGGTDWDSDW